MESSGHTEKRRGRDKIHSILLVIMSRSNGTRQSKWHQPTPLQDAAERRTQSRYVARRIGQHRERCDQALLRIQNYQHQIEDYYDKKVKSRPLEFGDLVLPKVLENTKEWKAGKLGGNWDGPYKSTQVIKSGVYQLETSSGETVPRE